LEREEERVEKQAQVSLAERWALTQELLAAAGGQGLRRRSWKRRIYPEAEEVLQLSRRASHPRRGTAGE
jgi:hypothetical protein